MTHQISEQQRKIDALVERLTPKFVGPGAPFEIGMVEVRGVRMKSFVGQNQVLCNYIERHCRTHAEKTFIVHGERRTTFGEFHAEARQLAAALQHELGVRAGDRVAIASVNCTEWCLTYVACALMGAVCVPLNSWWKVKELAYALNDCGAKVLLCDKRRMEHAIAARSTLKGPLSIVVVSHSPAPSPVYEYGSLIRAGFNRTFTPSNAQADDNCVIMYTSGTTGHPKGVVLTHRGIMNQMIMTEFSDAMTAKVMELAKMPPPTDQPCAILPVPLFHVTASHHVFLSSFAVGRKMVIMARWDPKKALELIERERATAWTGVPTMVQDLMEHPDFASTDTSSLLSVGAGGAPTPHSMVSKVCSKFANALPAQGYGLTETNGAVTWNRGEHYMARPTSCGKYFPITDTLVVDVDTGKPLPPGSEGELVVRSALIMKEYWGKPEATAKVMLTVNGEPGFFRTGDVARIDDEGYVYILDRAKDVIIRGGENISCAEVEGAVYEHPGVMECAVFGVPHERLGENVGVAVMPKPNSPMISSEEIVACVKERLAGFKVPLVENVFWVSSPLPRGATGKVLKRSLREQYKATHKARL